MFEPIAVKIWGTLFDTNVGLGPWPLLLFSFTFRYLVMSFLGRYSDGQLCRKMPKRTTKLFFRMLIASKLLAALFGGTAKSSA